MRMKHTVEFRQEADRVALTSPPRLKHFTLMAVRSLLFWTQRLPYTVFRIHKQKCSILLTVISSHIKVTLKCTRLHVIIT